MVSIYSGNERKLYENHAIRDLSCGAVVLNSENYNDEKGIAPKYIQRLFLNVLRYRILQDKLLPYYFEGKEYEDACNRVIELIKKIQNQTILEFKQMDKYHKAYLIKLKGDENITLNKSYDGQSYSINDKNRILFTESKIEIVINRFKIRNDMLYVLGYLKSPLLMYKKPEMYLVYEDKKKEIHGKHIQWERTQTV